MIEFDGIEIKDHTQDFLDILKDYGKIKKTKKEKFTPVIILLDNLLSLRDIPERGYYFKNYIIKQKGFSLNSIFEIFLITERGFFKKRRVERIMTLTELDVRNNNKRDVLCTNVDLFTEDMNLIRQFVIDLREVVESFVEKEKQKIDMEKAKLELINI
jgi:hypothetical protein